MDCILRRQRRRSESKSNGFQPKAAIVLEHEDLVQPFYVDRNLEIEEESLRLHDVRSQIDTDLAVPFIDPDSFGKRWLF